MLLLPPPSRLLTLLGLLVLTHRTSAASPFTYHRDDVDPPPPPGTVEINNNTDEATETIDNELADETEQAVANLLRCLNDLDQEIDGRDTSSSQIIDVLNNSNPGSTMPSEYQNDVRMNEGNSSLRRYFSEFTSRDEHNESLAIQHAASPSVERSGRDSERKRQYEEAFSAVQEFSDFIDVHFELSEHEAEIGTNPGTNGTRGTPQSKSEMEEVMDRKWRDVLQVLTDAIVAVDSVTAVTNHIPPTQQQLLADQLTASDDETWEEVFNILDNVQLTLDQISVSSSEDSPSEPKQTKTDEEELSPYVFRETASSLLQAVTEAARGSTVGPWLTLELLKDFLFNTKSVALALSLHVQGDVVSS